MLKPGFVAPAPLAKGSVRYVSPAVAPRWHAVATPMTTGSRTRRPENAPGNIFVDTSCIDCDTCRWLAPETFHVAGDQSAVHSQPQTPAAIENSQRALAACPTGSIRTENPVKESKAAMASFPLPVTGTLTPTPVPGVYFNGFTSKETYGCASWLLIHHGENPCAVMFDCPRFFKPLAEAVKKLTAPVGGVKYIILSHKDDVAFHDMWAQELGAPRLIHETEVTEPQGTAASEIKLRDEDFPYQLDEGLELIQVPGHSPGSLVMLHKPSQSLFTADHFAFYERLNHLAGSTMHCTQSWELQIQSVEKLADIPFLHGWPGHRRHFHFKDEEDRRAQIADAAKFMRSLECHLP